VYNNAYIFNILQTSQMGSQSTRTSRERKKRWKPLKPSKHRLNVALVKKCDSESVLNAMPPIHTSMSKAALIRLRRLLHPNMRMFNSKKIGSPWRALFFAEYGVDYVNTPGDPTREIEDLTNPTANIQEKYTSWMAPFLRDKAAKLAALQDKRRKICRTHQQMRPDLYDGPYSDEDECLYDSDPNTDCDSDMVYDSDFCSE